MIARIAAVLSTLILMATLAGCANLLGGAKYNSESGEEEGSSRNPRDHRPFGETDDGGVAREMMPADGVPNSGSVQNLEPRTQHHYKNGSRATGQDFIDDSQEEGSLWASSGQTNYYLTKNKVRSPGDMVVLTAENDLFKDIVDEIKRTLTPRERQTEVFALQDFYRKKLTALRLAQASGGQKDSLTASAAAPTPTGSNTPAPAASPGTAAAPPSQKTPAFSDNPEVLEKQIAAITIRDVDLAGNLGLKTGETMMGEIVERYPNGNYKIRSVKRVQYKNGSPRFVSVAGVVRAMDINEDTDNVPSGKLYEYRVEVAH